MSATIDIWYTYDSQPLNERHLLLGPLRAKMGTSRDILVFSSTFYIKSLFVTSVTGFTGINYTMAKTKAGVAATKAPYHPTAAKAPKFKAPTAGLEDVIFKYRANMKPGSFQG